MANDGAVAFLDVGHGSCTVAWDEQTREGIIVDCPPWGVQAALDFVRVEPIAQFCLALSTHSHLDHLGGLYAFSHTAWPKVVAYNLDTSERGPKLEASLRGFLELEQGGVGLSTALAGLSGSCGAVSWDVLAPTHGEVTAAWLARRPNEASAILRLVVGRDVFLIPGDAETRLWQRLAAEGCDLRADVLLLPHHGALPRGGIQTIETFIKAVDAGLCVVSAGDPTQYGHPVDEVVRAVEDGGALLLSTNAGGSAGDASPRAIRVTSRQAALTVVAPGRNATTLPRRA